MNYTSSIPLWNVENKWIVLRADLNVPLNKSEIANDYRLQGVLPTIDALLKKKGRILLLTHLGRPTRYDPALSTKILVPWFINRHYKIAWAENPEHALELEKKSDSAIILLDNLRFFPGEKTGDTDFARKLAVLGQFYVDDAFGSLHREDSSISVLPTLFAPDHRTIGLLVEKELTALNKLLYAPEKPFIMILGGGKVTDKLPLIDTVLDKVQTILLCPATVCTFLKAKGYEVGKSLVDQTALPLCMQIIKKAEKLSVKLEFPLDYLIALDTKKGVLKTVDAHEFPGNGIALSIGPKTIASYSAIIQQANTIFFNAAMGFQDVQESGHGTQALLEAIARSKAFSVVGGGDSVTVALNAGLSSELDFLSTGGGATLMYLGGKILPGLKAIFGDEKN